ncbi:hypothetical protein AVEN_226428-1, partial [Araneus ventricosus]
LTGGSAQPPGWISKQVLRTPSNGTRENKRSSQTKNQSKPLSLCGVILGLNPHPRSPPTTILAIT